eukprot:CAMPEP_0114670518 /NCGR_PEP_ID=MMETSP0191-20121206/39624_1 /TAXON_ID=126664 /ORGANISM="Sorites sp." /LENGTH=347 /DNA_ID=CAMNT_0001928213 /DNA_START=46 /DNA_END=1089 /DNA_ORIENTATION=-
MTAMVQVMSVTLLPPVVLVLAIGFFMGIACMQLESRNVWQLLLDSSAMAIDTIFMQLVLVSIFTLFFLFIHLNLKGATYAHPKVAEFFEQTGFAWVEIGRRNGFDATERPAEFFYTRWVMCAWHHMVGVLMGNFVPFLPDEDAHVVFVLITALQVGHDVSDLVVNAMQLASVRNMPLLGPLVGNWRDFDTPWVFLKKHILFHHALTIVALVPLNVAGLARQPLYQSMVWWLLLDGACGIIVEIYKAGMQQTEMQRNHPNCQLMEFVKSVLALHTRLCKFGYTFYTGFGSVRSVGSSFLLLAYFLGMLGMGYFNWFAVRKALRTIRRVLLSVMPEGGERLWSAGRRRD